MPALSLASVMPDAEWDALGPDEQGKGEATHPQYHLKLLLDRMGVARGEVQVWPASGRSASPAVRAPSRRQCDDARRTSAINGALKPAERRLTGVRAAEFLRCRRRSAGIALALARALETPGQTAALVTPDRMLARRVSALLQRWGIEADDSAGRPLSETPAGTLLLGIAAAAAEELAPVPLLALLKHPLVGGEGEDAGSLARTSADARPRAARPTARGWRGGLDAHIREREAEPKYRGCAERGCNCGPASSRSPECSRSRSGWPSSLGGSPPPRTAGRRPGVARRRRTDRRRAARRNRSCAAGGHDDDHGRGRRARASPTCSSSSGFGRPMAGIRAFSFGACSKRACSRRTIWSSADSTKAYGRPRPRRIHGLRPKSAPTSDCRGSNIASACRRMISRARSAPRRCWSRERGATRARRRSPRASGCGCRR